MKILVVDDSVATLDTFKALFEMGGHIAFTAHNVSAALSELAQRPETNLIITDYYLPDDTGAHFCKKLRGIGNESPIIILTAADEGTVAKLKEEVAPLGNVLVMRKPIDPTSLLFIIGGITVDSKILRAVPPPPPTPLSLSRSN